MFRITLVSLVVLISFTFFSCHAQSIHVAIDGDDSNVGSIEAPFRTINKAARTAKPGDVIYIHEGTYREYVNPTTSGSAAAYITFTNFEGGNVLIKGSEQISDWVNVDQGIWKIELDESYFNGYNPYKLYVDGDFQNYGQWHHRGDVYIDNAVLDERQSMREMIVESNTWWTEERSGSTIIYANFGDANPNETLTEINVRELIFFPSKPVVNYIHLDGIRYHHAAPNWQAPNVGNDNSSDPGRVTQIGAVGAAMCKGWIVENCEVMFSKTAGMMFGEHVTYSGSQYENIELYGFHTIQNNVIHHCGEYGIAGQKGISSSLIKGNLVEHINYRNEFGGYETAGIKIWNNADVTIENNLIRGTRGSESDFGIWVDYGNQNTRLSRNIIYDNYGDAIYLEANFGPTLLDHNLVFGDGSSRGLLSHSGGTVLVHNLFVKSKMDFDIQYFDNGNDPSNGRNATLLAPHSLQVVDFRGVLNIENKVYNNVFVGAPTTKQFPSGSGDEYAYNALLDGAKSITGNSTTNYVDGEFDTNYELTDDEQGCDFSMQYPQELLAISSSMITSDFIGEFSVSQQKMSNQDGSDIVLNEDIEGDLRSGEVAIGPWANIDTDKGVSWRVGLTKTETIDLSHEPTEPILSVGDDVNLSKGIIYPNPTNGSTIVQFSNLGNQSFKVLDSQGKLIHEGKLHKHKAEVSFLNTGLYWVIVKGEKAMPLIVSGR
ncbi:MAG: right-handed parallel beta-helix repeat-containing protein [Reichenbachiella sp.]